MLGQREGGEHEAVGVDDVGGDDPVVLLALHDAGDPLAVAHPLQAGDEGGAAEEEEDGGAVVEAVGDALRRRLVQLLAGGGRGRLDAAEDAPHGVGWFGGGESRFGGHAGYRY